MELFAIDPGNKESAYVLLNIADSYDVKKGCFIYHPQSITLRRFGKESCWTVAEILENWLASALHNEPRVVAIERVQAMGMPVGYEIFETCEWIGRYSQLCDLHCVAPQYVYRLEEKITLCNDSKAKDANIRQALIDRFAKHDFKNGKGTKANPDVFYGFKADIWAAMAVATTCMDQLSGTGHKATWRR